MGFDSWDMYNVGEHNLYPGPIDNSGLFSGNFKIIFFIIVKFQFLSHAYLLLLHTRSRGVDEVTVL